MRIFRVETKNGNGPWHGITLDLLCVFYYEYVTHPGPIRDELHVDSEGHWIYGCESLAQLSTWFVASCTYRKSNDDYNEKYRILKHAESIDLGILNKHKFMINAYDVNKKYCKKGKSQSQWVFNKSHSKKIATFPIKKLFSDYSLL